MKISIVNGKIIEQVMKFSYLQITSDRNITAETRKQAAIAVFEESYEETNIWQGK